MTAEELLANPGKAELTAILQADSVKISSQAIARSQNRVSRNFVGGAPQDSTWPRLSGFERTKGAK